MARTATQSPARQRDASGARETGSARRALRVLSTFSVDTPRHTAESIARRLALPQSSVYRYLAVLREAGFIGETNAGASWSTRDRAVCIERVESGKPVRMARSCFTPLDFRSSSRMLQAPNCFRRCSASRIRRFAVYPATGWIGLQMHEHLPVMGIPKGALRPICS